MKNNDDTQADRRPHKPVDEMNPIKHSSKKYECVDCDREFEYISQAKDHQQSHGGSPGVHDFRVIDRD